MTRRHGSLFVILGVTACTPPAPSGTPAPSPTPRAAADSARPTATADTGVLAGLPPGRGTLRQEEISIRLDLTDVTAQLLPLDESVIRVLSPDSYRAIRAVIAAHDGDLGRLTRQYHLRERQLWRVSFIGLANGARFTPRDLTLTQAGREFRPLDVVPLTRGFGSERLQAGQNEQGLYLFDDGLSLSQPLTASMASVRSMQWESILRVVERERVLIRQRGGTHQR